MALANRQKIRDFVEGKTHRPIDTATAPSVNGKAKKSPLQIERAFVPFPVAALPPCLREMVETVSEARNFDPAMVASLSLSAAASLVGTAYRITPNLDWYEDCALWAAVICESGTRKTPAFRAAFIFVEEEQRRLIEEYEAAKKRDREALSEWLAAEKGDRGPRPVREAVKKKIMTTDGTIEGIGRALLNNPRGIIYAAEEIDTWFKSMTRYNSDTSAYYLKMYSAGILSTCRSDPEKEIDVARALVSVAGTIQPEVFQSAMTTLNIASGLLARPLFCWPEPRVNILQDEPKTARDLDHWCQVQGMLYRLQPIDSKTPRDLRLSTEAFEVYKPWHNQHAVRVFDAVGGATKNADNKLFGQALRLALIHHLISSVHYGDDVNRSVQVESVEAALTMANWWSNEHARIYSFLGTCPAGAIEGLLERIVRYFRRRPDCASATQRDLQQALKGADGAVDLAELRLACDALAADGYGKVETTGEVSTRFVFTFNRMREDLGEVREDMREFSENSETNGD